MMATHRCRFGLQLHAMDPESPEVLERLQKDEHHEERPGQDQLACSVSQATGRDPPVALPVLEGQGGFVEPAAECKGRQQRGWGCIDKPWPDWP